MTMIYASLALMNSVMTPAESESAICSVRAVRELSLASFPQFTGSICADGEDAWGEATEEGRESVCMCMCVRKSHRTTCQHTRCTHDDSTVVFAA